MRRARTPRQCRLVEVEAAVEICFLTLINSISSNAPGRASGCNVGNADSFEQLCCNELMPQFPRTQSGGFSIGRISLE